MSNNWADKLKKYLGTKQQKTPAEYDREADVCFLDMLEEEKRREEK